MRYPRSFKEEKIMKGGAPALVIEFDTAPVSFDQFVSVLLTNTGQDETFAILTLTPTSNISGDVQEVGVDLPAGATTETIFNPVDSKFGDTSWLSIRSES